MGSPVVAIMDIGCCLALDLVIALADERNGKGVKKDLRWKKHLRFRHLGNARQS